MGSTRHIVFAEVAVKGYKRGHCQGCGKRTQRTEKFYQTLNPFNKNADGLPKNRDEILTEIRFKRDAWQIGPLVCTACESK